MRSIKNRYVLSERVFHNIVTHACEQKKSMRVALLRINDINNWSVFFKNVTGCVITFSWLIEQYFW